jgi:hypothetical protein
MVSSHAATEAATAAPPLHSVHADATREAARAVDVLFRQTAAELRYDAAFDKAWETVQASGVVYPEVKAARWRSTGLGSIKSDAPDPLR